MMDVITWASVGPGVVIPSTKSGPSGFDEAQTCLMSSTEREVLDMETPMCGSRESANATLGTVDMLQHW